MRKKRWSIAIVLSVLVLGLIAAGVFLPPLAERWVRQQLDLAAAQVGARVDQVHPPGVSVLLLSRSVHITGLELVRTDGPSDRPLTMGGKADTLDVSGVSIWGALFGSTLSARSVRVRISDASILLHSDTVPHPATEARGKDWRLAIGSFDVRLHNTQLVQERLDTTYATLDELHFEGGTFRFHPGQENPLSSLHFGRMTLSTDCFHATTTTGYASAIEHAELDQQRGSLDLIGATLDPTLGLEAHSDAMRYETDVFQVRLDTLQIRGFDMDELLAQRTWRIHHIRVASGDITVLRDKTLPDGPDHVKPLLSRVIRNFPPTSGVDSIVVAGLDIRYRERGDRSRGYAMIPFRHIHGLITGARNSADPASRLVVEAQALAFDTAHITLSLNAVVQDTTDRFDLMAEISPMPFTALNRATGPLIDVQATEGRMDSLRFRMSGDDHDASGTIRMTYEGLKLAAGGRKSGETMNGLKSMLMNSIVRDKHRETDGVPRYYRYTLQRRRYHSIFNYMWSGLREGVKVVVLPEVSLK